MADGPGTPRADGPDAALLADLNGDAPFLVRIGPPDLIGDLEAALERLDPVRCAVVRVGNPLKAPFTPQRLMLQLAPDDEDGFEGAGTDDADRLLRSVTVRAASRPSLLVVVEQADTLTPPALALLQLLPGLRGPGVPAVRVAFQGTATFRALLRDPRFRPIRDHDADLSPPRPSGRPLPGRRGVAMGVASLAIVSLLAATLLLFRVPSPVITAPGATASPSLLPAATALPAQASTPEQPRPAATGPAVAPPGATSQPSSMPDPAAPSPPQPSSIGTEDLEAARARLFREFNAFLRRNGLAGRLSRSDREALFQEYLARHHASTAQTAPHPGTSAPSAPARTGTTPSDAGPASSSPEPEVVLFVRGGHPGTAAQAEQYSTLLRRNAANVTVRPAPDGPTVPTVRFFRPEDRSHALDIALSLPATTPDWQVVDLSGAADRPARTAIEVWLP